MEKETEKQNLGSGSIPGLMIKLAVPTIIAQLVNLLYNLVDRIYIGHIREVGDIALTGLGLCFPVLMMVTAFAMLSVPVAHREPQFIWEKGTMRQRSVFLETV